MLADFLPTEPTETHATVRKRTIRNGKRLDEQVMQETGVRGPKRMTDASLRCSFPEIGEMNSDQEIPGELVVSGGDTAEVFEPAKAALDDISAFVGAFVEAMDDDAVGFVGDDGLGAATNNFAAKVVAVTHTLCQRGARSWAARAPGR